MFLFRVGGRVRLCKASQWVLVIRSARVDGGMGTGQMRDDQGRTVQCNCRVGQGRAGQDRAGQGRIGQCNGRAGRGSAFLSLVSMGT